MKGKGHGPGMARRKRGKGMHVMNGKLMTEAEHKAMMSSGQTRRPKKAARSGKK